MADVRHLVLLLGFIGSFTGCNCNDASLAPAELLGDLVLDPDHLDFGSVEVGSTTEQRLEIRNDGQGDLMITSAVGDGTPFVLQAAPNSEIIPAGKSAPFAVTFNPSASGVFEGTIAIAHDGLNGPISTLYVRGSGKEPPQPMTVAFEVEPASLDFGSMETGASRSMTFFVRNTGDLSLDISGISLENSNQYVVRPAQNVPMQLAAGASLPVEVTYTGTVLGRNTGRAVVTTNAPEATKGVDLQAEAYGPEIEVLPNPLEFGVVGINSLAAGKWVTIRNTGTRPLSVQSVDFRASSGELRELSAPSAPFVLAAGASEEIEIEYDPIDTGLDEGSLVVTSDDLDEHIVTVAIAGTGGDPTGCSLAALNAPVDFGYVMRGGRSTLALTLVNVGLQPCSLTDAQMIGQGSFSMNPDRRSLPATIPPQGYQHVLVDYLPRAYGAETGTVLLETTDARHRVPLAGKSAESQILALPTTIDFGGIAFGCTSGEAVIRLYNRGDHDEDFLALHPAPGTSLDFEITSDHVGNDIEDDDDDYLEVFVRYRPTTLGSAAGAVVIEHSGPASPLVIPLFADGSAGANITDSFRQARPGKVDVLFVLDGSDDMHLEREQLVANAASFINAADASLADYQIAVTSMDTSSNGEQGRIYAAPLSIVTPRTADRVASLAAVFGANLGDDGDERGLEAAFLGLTDRTLNETNAGFHRDSAALSVIYVSNEDDHSGWPFFFYSDALTSLKGLDRRDQTAANALIGTDDDGFCNTQEGGAEFGDDYLWIADEIGGRIESMCESNYSASLAALADESFGPRRIFHLSSWPATQAVGVKVDGVAAAASDFSYLPYANAIRFTDAATPREGATVEISYASECY